MSDTSSEPDCTPITIDDASSPRHHPMMSENYSLGQSFADEDGDNIDEILHDGTIPLRKKCWQLFKLFSIYKTPNGIFHKNKVFYVTKLSLIASMTLMIFVIIFIMY
jgi:hypothetical protein